MRSLDLLVCTVATATVVSASTFGLRGSAFTRATTFADLVPNRRLADVTCTIFSDADYSGTDIASVSGASAADCCAKCGAQSGCGAFTWTDWNGGTCWLKSGQGTTTTKAGAKSARVSPSNSAGLSCAIEVGVDYAGNDITSVAGSAPSDCCAKCSAVSGCGAFTWTDWNGGTCWLKSAKGEATAKSDTFSGVISGGPTATCGNVETGVDYIGNDVGSVTGSGAADCCNKCGTQSGCGAFTWTDWNGGTCWLKSGKGATRTAVGVISSVLGSAPTPAKCATVETGYAYTANDIGNVPGSGATDCCAKCGATTGCWAFTWTNFNGGTCWLKSIRGDVTVSLGSVSGVLPGAPTPSPTTAPPLTPRPTTRTPPPSGHVQWRLRAGVIPARSANLGGWLVGEYWMSYTSPMWRGLSWNTSMSGEYYAMKALGKTVGTAQFEAHRQTWITESDIVEIVASGLNTVRVPIGFWIINDDPSVPANDITRTFAVGALKYLDTLINVWAVRYNIAVMISLHSHQGSQNGNDHSSPQVYGFKGWSTSQANVDNSLQFATYIAARYKNSEAFLGLNLMNEPSLPTSYDVLLGYYTEAYRRIRATGNDCIIVTSPMVENQNPSVMMDFMRPPNYFNVWHEFHPYFKWGYEGQNEQQLIDSARGYRSWALDKWTGNPLYLGEWSLGSPEESAPFRDRALQKTYAAVQLQNYEAATSGWAFWAWRNDQELNTTSNGILIGWSMRQLLREGIFTVPRV